MAFRSATDLAEHIVEDKKANSVAAFILQITRGERPCPRILNVAIKDAIRARTTPAKAATEALGRFERLLAELASAPRLEPKLTDAGVRGRRAGVPLTAPLTTFVLSVR